MKHISHIPLYPLVYDIAHSVSVVRRRFVMPQMDYEGARDAQTLPQRVVPTEDVGVLRDHLVNHVGCNGRWHIIDLYEL